MENHEYEPEYKGRREETKEGAGGDYGSQVFNS
jgi:hypothetical protein